MTIEPDVQNWNHGGPPSPAKHGLRHLAFQRGRSSHDQEVLA
jgi:hypothetical protein